MSLIRPVNVDEKDSDDYLHVLSLPVDNNISRLSYSEASSSPEDLFTQEKEETEPIRPAGGLR